jgi:Leucine-rich repeat (LRR) protein
VAILAGNIKLAVRLLEVGADADLSNCELTEIPDVILRLVAAGVITKLDVSNNKLTLLPSGLISAKEVTFRGNPLTAVPQEYRDKWANYKRFLAKNEKGSQKLVVDDTPRRKILVVGAENTGKTSVTKV